MSAELGRRISIHSIFGQVRYLEKVTDKLYDNNINYGRDIELLTKEQFFDIAGKRITEQNKERINQVMESLGLQFKPS